MIVRLAAVGLSLIVPALVFAGCGSGANSAAHPTATTNINPPHNKAAPLRSELIGKWQIIEVHNVAAQYPARWPVPANANLTFSANADVSGTDSTNSYAGHFTVSSTGLHFARVTSTLVGLSQNAQPFRQALQAAFGAILQSGKPVEARASGAELILQAGNYELILGPRLYH